MEGPRSRASAKRPSSLMKVRDRVCVCECVLLGYGGRGSSVLSVTHERSPRGRQELWNGRGLVPAAGGHFSENNAVLLRNACFSKAPPLGTPYRWTPTPPRQPFSRPFLAPTPACVCVWEDRGVTHFPMKHFGTMLSFRRRSLIRWRFLVIIMW